MLKGAARVQAPNTSCNIRVLVMNCSRITFSARRVDCQLWLKGSVVGSKGFDKRFRVCSKSVRDGEQTHAVSVLFMTPFNKVALA
jgi:hypothetical protein